MQTPLAYLRGGEVGPALGAARLAQVAIEGGDPADICIAPPIERIAEPEPDLISRFADKQAAFVAAYPRITPQQKG